MAAKTEDITTVFCTNNSYTNNNIKTNKNTYHDAYYNFFSPRSLK